MIKLQTLVFPNIDMPGSEDMYFRGQETGAVSFLKESLIDLPESSHAIFDTFFNGFSVRPWKQNCKIDDLWFAITGTGRVRIRIGLHLLHHASRWLCEDVITLSNQPINISISQWDQIGDGIIYVHVKSLEDSTIDGGYFYTNTIPQSEVKMGIVITHFNRKRYVVPAIDRISRLLIQDRELKGLIDLVVVDNSQNIEKEEAGNAIIIPNKNLGGSGGFMRGLLYLKDNGYTHCLFMDDDASCEMESIRRTLRLMQFSKNPKVAVAGSMLKEALPFQTHEVGASFRNGKWIPLKSGLDVRHIYDLLLAEEYRENIGYGGWWHFAFNLNEVKHFSFPFFVRGDDILFGIMNSFQITTMNGIGGWGEDFGIKESPFIKYLSMRSTMTLMLLTYRGGPYRYIRMLRRFTLNSLYSYNYSSARAFRLGLEHVMRGPDFWIENLDMVAVRAELAQQCPDEKVLPIPLLDDVVVKSDAESRMRKFVRKLTLNGFLLPSFLIKNRTIIDGKSYNGCFPRIYRSRRVAYIVSNTDLGYVATHDKKRFFIEYVLTLATAVKFILLFRKLRKKYRNQVSEFTNEQFWRNVYK